MHLTNILKYHSLLTFFSLTFLLTWACWIPLAASGVVQHPHPAHPSPLLLLQPLGNFMPALVAIMLTAFFNGKKAVTALLKKLGKWRSRPFWYAILNTFLVPLNDLRASLCTLLCLWLVIGLVAWLKPSFAQKIALS